MHMAIVYKEHWWCSGGSIVLAPQRSPIQIPLGPFNPQTKFYNTFGRPHGNQPLAHVALHPWTTSTSPQPIKNQEISINQIKTHGEKPLAHKHTVNYLVTCLVSVRTTDWAYLQTNFKILSIWEFDENTILGAYDISFERFKLHWI